MRAKQHDQPLNAPTSTPSRQQDLYSILKASRSDPQGDRLLCGTHLPNHLLDQAPQADAALLLRRRRQPRAPRRRRPLSSEPRWLRCQLLLLLLLLCCRRRCRQDAPCCRRCADRSGSCGPSGAAARPQGCRHGCNVAAQLPTVGTRHARTLALVKLLQRTKEWTAVQTEPKRQCDVARQLS